MNVMNSVSAVEPQRSDYAALIRRVASLLLVVLAIGLGSLQAAAQVIVVQSTAKSVRAGSALSNDAKVLIPAGAKAVFVLPSGATRTVSGPFDGRAGDLTKGVKANPGVFEAVKRYVQTGGSSQKSVGAVRSAAAPLALGKPLPFSWRTVPLSSNGDVCLERGVSVELVRSRTAKAQTITVVDMKTKQRAKAVFAAGQGTAAWPPEIAMQAGTTYALLTAGRRARQIRLRLISPLPPPEDVLQVLHHQRCQGQFRNWIRSMQLASK